jgi:hypothetical protein
MLQQSSAINCRYFVRDLNSMMIEARHRASHLVAKLRPALVPKNASFDHSQTTTILSGARLAPARAALYTGLRLSFLERDRVGFAIPPHAAS